MTTRAFFQHGVQGQVQAAVPRAQRRGVASSAVSGQLFKGAVSLPRTSQRDSRTRAAAASSASVMLGRPRAIRGAGAVAGVAMGRE